MKFKGEGKSQFQVLRISPETARFKSGSGGSHVQSQRMRQKGDEFKPARATGRDTQKENSRLE